MTHPILTSHPGYQAHEKEVAKLADAESEWRERVRPARDEYEHSVADYHRRKREALLAGEPPPLVPAPPVEGSPDEARIFADERTALRAVRRELLADLAPEIEEAAHQRMQEITGEALPHIEKLQRLAEEAAELVGTVRKCLLPKERSENVPAGHGRADRMRHGVSVLDLAAAVVDGLSLFDPVEPEPARLVAASFDPPQPAKLSRPLSSQDRSPSPLQVKGA